MPINTEEERHDHSGAWPRPEPLPGGVGCGHRIRQQSKSHPADHDSSREANARSRELTQPGEEEQREKHMDLLCI